MIGFNTNDAPQSAPLPPIEARADFDAPPGYCDGAEGALPWDDEAAVIVESAAAAAAAAAAVVPAPPRACTVWLDNTPGQHDGHVSATRFANGGVSISVHARGTGMDFVGLHLSVAASRALQAFLNGEGA